MPFSCSICAEESTRICTRCTKDACNNHLCEKCGECSDCCECEVRLTETTPEMVREPERAMLPVDEEPLLAEEPPAIPEFPANPPDPHP